MESVLIEEIAIKSATLPIEQQRVVLDFVNSMIAQDQAVAAEPQARKSKTPPFRSVRGTLNRKLETLEEDLAEVRREMWQNFPRDFPDTESQ
ncbi:MAG: hypothetical protein ABI977_02285 [Acidobacteriota bacterium]